MSEIVEAVKEAFIEYDLVAEEEAQKLAEEIVNSNDIQVLKDFLKVVESARKDIIKDIAEHKKGKISTKQLVKELSKLKDSLDDVEFLLKLAK